MSTAVDVLDDAPGREVEVRQSILPAPTMPAGLVPASDYAPAVREEQFGGGCMGISNAYGGSRSESIVNKKPFALVKLGHKLCGFGR